MRLKLLSIVAGVALTAITTNAQVQDLQLTGETIRLEIKQEGGKNGTAVTFDPKNKIYYAAIAGNAKFPLEAFNESGRNISQSETSIDTRGLWWNKKDKQLQGNGYNEFGIFKIDLDQTGHPIGRHTVLLEGSNQPSSNSVGCIDKKGKQIIFYYGGTIKIYNLSSGERERSIVPYNLPCKVEDINSTTPIYTGKSKMEIGLLNFDKNEVYFLNIKDGSHTATVRLPKNVEAYNIFRFSYANGFIFLYDVDARVWTGYRVWSK